MIATLLLSIFLNSPGAPVPGEEHGLIQGVTISCQSWGWEWGSDGFGDELDELSALGVNWVAIHPYARIRADGSVTWRTIDPEEPPVWLRRPIQEAHARGMAIFVKPHLAYWGSPFSWRGEIDFEGEERERFFRDYNRWIVEVAGATRDADAFAIGTELDRMIDDTERWRAIARDVREVSNARLTYAANWTDYQRIGFWDALDAIGVQAYFPLTDTTDPDQESIAAGWAQPLASLKALSLKTGKPVVFTELGYNLSLDAAREPWSHRTAMGADRERALRLQKQCLEIALATLDREREWLRGAFLWKWFVGDAHRADFKVDSPTMRGVLNGAWGSRVPDAR